MKNHAFHSDYQHTLKQPVNCEGIGLHSGKPVKMRLQPAAAGSGISFLRSDLSEVVSIPADATLVGDTRLGTSLNGAGGHHVATVEHLMAALWGAGVDNVKVMLDAPEVPIMDGSSQPFMDLIAKVGVEKQTAKREIFAVTEVMHVKIGESELELHPYDGFAVDIAVEYNHPTIAKQVATYDFSECNFNEALAEARTFGFAHEVEMMREMGLARGGSLQNAIVLGEEGVLNPEGLRSSDEFVRHKALDLVGDLFLTGMRLKARVVAHKPGHQINTTMAQKLIAAAAEQRDIAWEAKGDDAVALSPAMAAIRTSTTEHSCASAT